MLSWWINVNASKKRQRYVHSVQIKVFLFVCVSLLPWGRNQPLLGITEVQLFWIELKPVKRVTADVNLKIFHHKILYATEKPTLNMGGTNHGLALVSFLSNQTVGEHQRSGNSAVIAWDNKDLSRKLEKSSNSLLGSAAILKTKLFAVLCNNKIWHRGEIHCWYILWFDLTLPLS